MVRTIDGEQRRRVLAEAVWRIIRRDGLDGASVRAVAVESGLSTGSVRHFFGTQDELHVFAMDELIRQITGSVRQLLSDPPRSGPPWTPERTRAAVREVLLELLPVTAEHEDLFLVQLQFIVKAAVRPVLRPTARRLAVEVHQLVEHLVQSLVDTGAAPADLDVVASSTALTALLDGITLRRLTTPELLSRSDAVRLVDDCLDRWELTR